MSRNPADRQFGKIQFWRARTSATATSGRTRRGSRLVGLVLESCEARELMTLPPTLTIPLLPDLDQFGDQILIVQGFDDPARAALGIFDTGASAVTFAAQDQEIFGMGDVGQIPIKVPGGASAEGIGGAITGDVSEPGTIFSDGMHAFNLSFDDIGFPQFNITLSDSAVETPGIQTFVGTEASPLLPTITGTPALLPSSKYINGAAAHIKMQGASLDFSDLMPGMIIPFPDLVFANPGDSIIYDPNNADIYETVTLPFVTFGGNNSDDPGDLITETELYLIPNITATFDTVTTTPGSFLFDTGAQLSVISTDMATRLGLDLESPTTTIDVQGVAGNETIPGYTLKSLDVQRADGGTLQFTDVPIYVLDVAPGIDGIFGMNLLNLANEFVFDPYNPGGPQLSIAFFANPDRSAPVDDGSGDLAALLGVVGLNVLGGAMGGSHYMPSFASPKTDSSTTLTSSATTLEYGASWSVSTTVGYPTGAATPTGLVDLKTNGQLFASPALNAQGNAVWNATGTPWEVGNYSVTAAYAGDSKYNASVSTATNIQIVKAATTLSIQSSGLATSFAQGLSFSGKLMSSTGVSTAGSVVQLLVDDQLKATTTTASNGSYAFNYSNLGVGSHKVRVAFPGSGHFGASGSDAVTVSVSKAASALTISAPATAPFGQLVPITAKVNGAGYEGDRVSFFDGKKPLGMAQIISGSAVWLFKASKVGLAPKFSAKVEGTDHSVAAASGSVSLKVVKAATTVAASQTPNSNSWLFVVAPVSPGAGTPSGQVKITLGGSKPKTITAKLSGGRYTYTVAGGVPVIKKISYVGDASFSASSLENFG